MILSDVIGITNIVSTVLAVLTAPVIALWIGSKLQSRSDTQKSKLALLGTLMATRHDSLSSDAIKALNLIDVVFVDDTAVKEAWSKYYSVLVDSGSLTDMTGTIPLQRESRRTLLLEMIKSAKLGGKISTADILRAYAPTLVSEQLVIDFLERTLKRADLEKRIRDQKISGPAIEAMMRVGSPGVVASRKDGAATAG
jgi:hypothetical protein